MIAVKRVLNMDKITAQDVADMALWAVSHSSTPEQLTDLHNVFSVLQELNKYGIVFHKVLDNDEDEKFVCITGPYGYPRIELAELDCESFSEYTISVFPDGDCVFCYDLHHDNELFEYLYTSPDRPVGIVPVHEAYIDND